MPTQNNIKKDYIPFNFTKNQWEDFKFYFIMAGIIIVIIFLITLLILLIQNARKDKNNIGIACSSTNDCTSGLQCSSGFCSIPAMGECTGYESHCANGAQCSSGICDSILPPIQPIIPIKPDEICQLQKKLIQDEEALNAFNMSLINQRDQMLSSVMESNIYDIKQLQQQLQQAQEVNQYLSNQLQQCMAPIQNNKCPC